MGAFYIGISGVARSGKDSFANLLENLIKLNYDNCIFKSSLALPLKRDCKDFIKDKLELDVFSQKTEDKSVFRDLLVWYATVKRKQSMGKYWTDKFDERSKKYSPEICIVCDLRYSEYEEDEIFWLKNKHNGILIHIERTDLFGVVVPPANNDEKRNDPKIKAAADYKLTWPTFLDDNKYENMSEFVLQAFQTVVKERLDYATNS